MENKRNQDTLSENANLQGKELSNQELEQAVGGQVGIGETMSSSVNDVERGDSQGRTTHWRNRKTGVVVHYTCPKCRRTLHEGTFGLLFCDPCDEWYTKSGANKVEGS